MVFIRTLIANAIAHTPLIAICYLMRISMKRKISLAYEFVDFIPEEVKDGYIYISIKYAIAIHKCCCGCGNSVITPLSPSGWSLIFDGESISLHPSIGNWNFKCCSHYFIRNNNVLWLPSHPKKIKLPQEPRVHADNYAKLSNNIWQRIRNWWIS